MIFFLHVTAAAEVACIRGGLEGSIPLTVKNEKCSESHCIG
jgi:hypothetical protein